MIVRGESTLFEDFSPSRNEHATLIDYKKVDLLSKHWHPIVEQALKGRKTQLPEKKGMSKLRYAHLVTIRSHLD